MWCVVRGVRACGAWSTACGAWPTTQEAEGQMGRGAKGQRRQGAAERDGMDAAGECKLRKCEGFRGGRVRARDALVHRGTAAESEGNGDGARAGEAVGCGQERRGVTNACAEGERQRMKKWAARAVAERELPLRFWR